MKRVLMTCLAVLLIALPEIGSGETVFYAFGGQVHTRPHQLTVSQPALGNYLVFDHAEFKDGSYTGPIYYGFRVSHFFQDHPRLGVEVEFIHPKALLDTHRESRVQGISHGAPLEAEVKISDYIQIFRVSHGFNFLLANLAYRYGFFADEKAPYGRLLLVARAGMGPTIIHPESNVDYHKHYIDKGGFELGGLGFQLSPGIELNLYRGLSAFAEYKYTYAQLDNITIASGEAKTIFESDHLAFGLAYHFQ